MFIKKLNAQVSIASILTLFIVVVLAVIPLHVAMKEYSNSNSLEENLIVNGVKEYEVGIEILVDNILYFEAGEKLNIKAVKVGSIDCDYSGEVKNLVPIDISSCLDLNKNIYTNVVVYTDKINFKYELVREKNVFGKFDINSVE